MKITEDPVTWSQPPTFRIKSATGSLFRPIPIWSSTEHSQLPVLLFGVRPSKHSLHKTQRITSIRCGSTPGLSKRCRIAGSKPRKNWGNSSMPTSCSLSNTDIGADHLVSGLTEKRFLRSRSIIQSTAGNCASSSSLGATLNLGPLHSFPTILEVVSPTNPYSFNSFDSNSPL